ncbi:MAG TPA: hypothetical protein VN258_01910 [Mobilitalea sp.]|nr:hypothetical protein [Mobilitalea sp.]
MSDQIKNNIFYVCSLIEYLGRKTKNRRSDIVVLLGKKEIERQLEIAEANHCLPLEQVAEELVEIFGISEGDFDSVGKSLYPIPGIYAIAKDYQRLIIDEIGQEESVTDTIYNVFQSFISDEISDFNSSVYYCNPDYLRLSYEEGKLLI